MAITTGNRCGQCDGTDLGMTPEGTAFCVDCDPPASARDQGIIDELLTLIEDSQVTQRDAGENRGVTDYEQGRIDAYRYAIECLQSRAF